MIDLTPLDVRKKRGDFRRLLRGYDPQEVDTFLDLVAERLEELVRENLALSDKLEGMEGQLKSLEGREKAIQEALVSAQKLSEEVGDQSRREAEVMREQASRTAEIMKEEAEAYIARRLAEADSLVRERKRALEELERSRLKFLKAFRTLLEREMDAMEVEEARRPLEDVTLELDLRGWTPVKAPFQTGIEEQDADEVDPGLGSELDEPGEWEVPQEPREAVGWEPSKEPGGSETPAEPKHPVETPESEHPHEPAEANQPEEPVGSGETDLSDDLSVAEDPAEVAGPDGISPSEWPPEDRQEDEWHPSNAEPSREPRWLFSLLKKDEEEREGEE